MPGPIITKSGQFERDVVSILTGRGRNNARFAIGVVYRALLEDGLSAARLDGWSITRISARRRSLTARVADGYIIDISCCLGQTPNQHEYVLERIKYVSEKGGASNGRTDG